MSYDICVIGLGYVGLPLAVSLAASGCHVTGVEINPDVVEKLSNGKTHIYEPGLQQLLRETLKSGNFKVTNNISEYQNQNHTYFIITVGTPVDQDNRCNLQMINNASEEIATILKDNDVVLLRSTVRPGVTASICKTKLDTTGKKYFLAFCPERIVEGNALQELKSIPTIIGCPDKESYHCASNVMKQLNDNIIHVPSYEAAEIIKLINNIKRDTSFALSNEIAMICEQLGVNMTEVLTAATTDYHRGAMPAVGLVGGPCLTKDIFLLNESLENSTYSPSIGLLARSVNDRIPVHGADAIVDYLTKYQPSNRRPNVSFLGLAFKGKPVTNDIRGTKVIEIIERLNDRLDTVNYCAYDPEVAKQDAELIGVKLVSSIEQAFHKSDVVIITSNHKEFESLSLKVMSKNMTENALIYDFWPQCRKKPEELDMSIAYIGFGEGLQIKKLL